MTKEEIKDAISLYIGSKSKFKFHYNPNHLDFVSPDGYVSRIMYDDITIIEGPSTSIGKMDIVMNNGYKIVLFSDGFCITNPKTYNDWLK